MATIYIDEAYKCHAENGEGRTAQESSYFDGKCKTFIESYRLIPDGQSWTSGNGTVFRGEMIAPHKDIAPALAAQEEYDRVIENAADYAAAYEEGVQDA